MTTQTATPSKLDALLQAIREYRVAATMSSDEANLSRYLMSEIRTLLEENERLVKVNDESAQELMDMCAHWKQKHEALRTAALAVVDAVTTGKEVRPTVLTLKQMMRRWP